MTRLLQVAAKTNELPPGAYGRHLFVVGEWSASVGAQLDAGLFPMATFEGSWGDCSFFETHGQSIRWLRIVNAQKKLDGLRFLARLEKLFVGFEPKDLAPIMKLPALRALEIIAKVPTQLLGHESLERLKISGATQLKIESENRTLRELLLDRPKFGSLQELQGLHSLKTLDIYSARGISDLDGVEQFPRLENLGIEACPQLTDLSNLVNAPSLRKLSVVRSPVSELPILANHPTLQFLHVGGHAVRAEWGDLFACRTLTYIAILVPQDQAFRNVITETAVNFGRTIDELTIVGGKDKFVTVKLA